MKKTMALLISLVLVGLLAGCNQNAGDTGKTGTFTAQRSDAYAQGDGYGFRDILTVTFEGGAITAASFDSEYIVGDSYPIGTMKSSLSDTEYPMTPPPSEWIPELNRQILEDGQVDGVAGATGASESARLLLQAIMEATDPAATIEVP